MRWFLCLALTLIPTLAMGQDTGGEIQSLPPGTMITLPTVGEDLGRVFVLDTKSWVVADLYFREAVAQAQELKIVRPHLDACVQTTLDLTAKIRTTAATCLTQFDGDQARIDDLVSTLSKLELRALDAEHKLTVVRTQRTIAWTIAGALIGGSAVTLAIVFAK